jgi:hypothetical protein
MTLHKKISYPFISFTLILVSVLSICAHTTYANDKDEHKNNKKTYNTVQGTIREADGTKAIGATVVVTCNHSGKMTTHTAVSAKNGTYSVIFDSLLCKKGDTLSVTAAGGNDQGSADGTMNNNRSVVNVTLIDNLASVPEFGSLAMMALAGTIGLGAFLRVRKGSI